MHRLRIDHFSHALLLGDVKFRDKSTPTTKDLLPLSYLMRLELKT